MNLERLTKIGKPLWLPSRLLLIGILGSQWETPLAALLEQDGGITRACCIGNRYVSL